MLTINSSSGRNGFHRHYLQTGLIADNANKVLIGMIDPEIHTLAYGCKNDQ